MSCQECSKGASYGYYDDGVRLYCTKHKLLGMVNLKTPKCTKCDKPAMFGYETAYRPEKLFCKNHKLPDTVNLLYIRRQELEVDSWIIAGIGKN